MPTDPAPGTDGLSEAERAELLERWHAVLPHQEAMAEALIRRYAEPHRRYHGTRHLLEVVRKVDELAGDQDLFLVRLAAWFHDAVYDIPERELTNEEASARLALRELSRAGLEQEDLTQVARLVRLTADHVPGSRDPEGELLCDADLAVLAGPPDAYAAYASAVREEYGHLSDAGFTAGRIAVVEHLLALPALYRTPEAAAQWADRATANLTAELSLLRARAASAPADPPPATG
jgi:predicted metal-dependent HD superfamily phosphohydrolase